MYWCTGIRSQWLVHVQMFSKDVELCLDLVQCELEVGHLVFLNRLVLLVQIRAARISFALRKIALQLMYFALEISNLGS
jgi:hypothetical protein